MLTAPRPLGLLLPALLLSAAPVLADATRPLGDRLSAYAPDRYLADRIEISARLEPLEGARPASDPGPALDLAELHLAHGLWAEAGSLLDALDPGALSASDRSRWDRLRLVASLFDRTGSDPDPALLIRGQVWPDLSLFRALLGFRDADLSEAAELIRAWPDPARETALPLLLERAVLAEDWAAARNLSAQVSAFPAIAGSSADLFLRGAAAERGGLPEEALAAYLEAGEGSDLWAARARLAWAELALSSDLAEPEEVRGHLARARALWRGGELGVETLGLLLEVTTRLGKTLDALDLVAEIRDRHPREADRVAPPEEVWALMGEFYAQGARGEVPFGPFLEGHLRLFRFLATEPRYLDLVEGLAEDLAARGAYRLAGEEYQRVLDTLTTQAESPHIRVPPERLDRVRLRLAELMLDAGQADEASALLEGPVREAGFANRLETLRARAYHDLGRWEEVLTAWVEEPGPAHLERVAVAHHALSDWDASRSAHIALLESVETPDEAAVDRLILASFRSGTIREDEALLRPLVSEDRGLLLDALLNADAAPTAMRRAAVESRLAEVSSVIGSAQAAAGEGETGLETYR